MSAESSSKPEFSKIRAYIFPIHNYELKKFIPLVLIMMCILFNYSILRSTKDALIATADGSGIEAIPYLKSIFVMISAAIFVVVYTKISNIFSIETLFYIFTSGFIVFFILFAFLIYPNAHALHPELSLVQSWQSEFPRFKFLFSVWGVWTYSLFYVMVEMWGSIMIPLLFWQFSNQIIQLSEAKRFYPMFILFGNVALIFSGTAMKYLCNVRHSFSNAGDAWGFSLKGLMILITIMGIIAMFAFRWTYKNVLIDPNYYNAAESKKIMGQKFKMGLLESLKYIISNRYICLIALLILTYSMSINLVELVWKKQVAIWYMGDANGYNTFMGHYVTWTGIVTIVIVFFTKGVINRFGWLTGAIATPAVLAITGVLFFSLILMGDLTVPLLTSVAIPATYLAMEVGMGQSILTRSFKYALFDPTKEMAYIPLDPELKAKGKAVVDIIGSRVGKTISSWSVLLMFYVLVVQDVMDIFPYIAVLLTITLITWICSVFSLNQLYKQKTTSFSQRSFPKENEGHSTKMNVDLTLNEVQDKV